MILFLWATFLPELASCTKYSSSLQAFPLCCSSRTLCCLSVFRNISFSLMSQSMETQAPHCYSLSSKSCQSACNCCRFRLLDPEAGKQTFHRCWQVLHMVLWHSCILSHAGSGEITLASPQTRLLNTHTDPPCLLFMFTSTWYNLPGTLSAAISLQIFSVPHSSVLDALVYRHNWWIHHSIVAEIIFQHLETL